MDPKHSTQDTGAKGDRMATEGPNSPVGVTSDAEAANEPEILPGAYEPPQPAIGHTSEPWLVGNCMPAFGPTPYQLYVDHCEMADGTIRETPIVARFTQHDWRQQDGPPAEVARSNAMRAALCVNFCRGIPNDWLENGMLDTVADTLRDAHCEAEAQRYIIRACLELLQKLQREYFVGARNRHKDPLLVHIKLLRGLIEGWSSEQFKAAGIPVEAIDQALAESGASKGGAA